MKYLIESGECKVEIEISAESTDLMRAVEESAARLLAGALAGRPEGPPKPPFGYSLASDTELATSHEQADDGDTE